MAIVNTTFSVKSTLHLETNDVETFDKSNFGSDPKILGSKL